MKQMRIAESKCNSLAPCSGKEANGKIEYGKNLMKHRKIYLAVSIGCLLMAAIYYQIESHFLINRNPFFYGIVQKWLAKEDERPLYYKNRVNAGLHVMSPEILKQNIDTPKIDLDMYRN